MQCGNTLKNLPLDKAAFFRLLYACRKTESGVGGEAQKGLQPLEIGQHMAFSLGCAGSSALAFVFKEGRGLGEEVCLLIAKIAKSDDWNLPGSSFSYSLNQK
jgi:hypothetical protein